MSLNDEQADILGGPLLQKPQTGLFALFLQHSPAFKGGILLALCLLAWVVFVRVREHIRRNRDLSYRKAMRRKHGIPDTDCRPFAVAYAAANRARTEREAKERNKLAGHVPSVSDHRHSGADEHRNAPMDVPHGQHHLRRRLPESVDPHAPASVFDYPRTGKRVQAHELKRPEAHPFDFAERYHPNGRYIRHVSESLGEPVSPVKRPAPRRFSRKNLRINANVAEESRKRSHATESDDEPDSVKKSRIDGEELIDGDEEADWYAQYANPSTLQDPVASSSRQHVHINGGSNEQYPEDDEQADEIMEDIDDDITELPSIPRGKKRDRAEAGSTFGADDEEDVRSEKPTRHRKRRSVSKRKGDDLSRGKKRDRELESPESEGGNDLAESSRRDGHLASRKKRASDEPKTDTSIEMARISRDTLCGGRKIGEEWEADGVQYKVGSKGERLRLTLVKTARNKYHMPKDSQHPDRAAALEIYVETWMTEEQYKEAEERRELVWQDVPSSTESRTPEVPDSPSKSGKDLLWDSVQGSPISRRPFRQSLTSDSTLRVNPFQQFQSQPNLSRRIASPSSSVSPHLAGLAESPTRPGFRGFSKWEKQDREAEAMAKIRAKMQEQKKTQTEAGKTSEQPASATTLTVPTITLTPASPSLVEVKMENNSKSTETKVPSSFSFTPVSATTTEPKTGSTSIPTSNTTPGFALPSTSAVSSTLPPNAPQATTNTPTTVSTSPAFSFALPTQPITTTAPTTTTTAPTTSSTSSAIPGFFAKPSTSSASSAIPTTTTTLPFTFSAPSQSQPASGGAVQTTAEAPKAPAFSFAKPSAPAIASKMPAVPVTTSAALFGTTPPSGTTAPPTIAPSESKPLAPVFSFSATPSVTNSATQPAPTLPKFSFGQPSTGSAFSTGAPSIAEAKSKFTFGAPTTAAPASTAVASETQKEVTPASVFGTKDAAAKPSPAPFGTTASAFSGSVFGSSTSTGAFGKQPEMGTSTSADAIGTSMSNSTPKTTVFETPTNMFAATPVGSPATASGPAPAGLFGNATSNPKVPSSFGNPGFGTSGSTPSFSFGKKDDTSTPAVAALGSGVPSKPTFSFGVASTNTSPAFGQPTGSPASGGTNTGSSLSFAATSKPAFPFASTSGSATSVFDGPSTSGTKDAPATTAGDASSKPTFSFNATPTNATSAVGQPTSATDNTAASASSTAAPKPAFSFAAGTPGTSAATSLTAGSDASKATFPFGASLNSGRGSAFGQPLASGANGAGSSTPDTAAAKPIFAFNAPSGGATSMFGQPSIAGAAKSPFAFGPSSGNPPSASTDSTTQAQSVFGKPSGTTPSAFGFSNTSGNTNTAFAFGKPPTQNQKQEQ